MNIDVSPTFKKMTTRAILSIVLFLIVYILLLLFSIWITVLCVIGAFYLITIRPSLLTLGLGVGLGSLGFFILAFLFKFMFKKHKMDRSHLTEITAETEPKLFQFIASIVNEVGTDFPKRVYLSSDVNASVFYDSSFWSMFFPVKKNLQIGLGLVNGISEQEFKAILAHEFGHFSQRSMKVGSYVYFVNQVIFNLLYDNESFDKMIQKWSSISNYFSVFLIVSLKIIEGIQWILKKMYAFINVAYLAMSREMEFHADEVAANVAGISPLQDSLLRMDLVDASYNAVLSFYGLKISEDFKSNNIYQEQLFVMDFLAKDSQLQIKDNLPEVTLLDISKFNKSKLVIENQWASHPSTEDRNASLARLDIHKLVSKKQLANTVFQDINKTQETITAKMFSSIENATSFTTLSLDGFKKEYLEKFSENSFNIIYNGYYDNYNTKCFDIDTVENPMTIPVFELLFDKERIDMVYDYIALQSDIAVLKNIANKELQIKSFDYDGHKFKSEEAIELIPKIENDSSNLALSITKNDLAIFNYFLALAKKCNQENELISKYKSFFVYDQQYDSNMKLHSDLLALSHFMSVVTPIEQIKSNLPAVYSLEIEIKKKIKEMLKDELYASILTPAIVTNFEMYLKKSWLYFAEDSYISSELEIYYSGINDYCFVLSRGYFLLKKDLLDFQNQLLVSQSLAF